MCTNRYDLITDASLSLQKELCLRPLTYVLSKLKTKRRRPTFWIRNVNNSSKQLQKRTCLIQGEKKKTTSLFLDKKCEQLLETVTKAYRHGFSMVGFQGKETCPEYKTLMSEMTKRTINLSTHTNH